MDLNAKEQEARSKICLPLDGLENFDALKGRVSELSPVVGLFKIGFESYTQFGPKSVEYVRSQGSDVFLDLKYKDIPNTVKGAATKAAALGVRMFNVHASGGVDMMRAAADGAADGAAKYGESVPSVTAVTVLTSFDEASYLRTFQPLTSLEGIELSRYSNLDDDEEEMQDQFRGLLDKYGYASIINTQVLHLARLTKEAGLAGIVCATADLSYVVPKIKDPEFQYVTPGVKHPDTENVGGDQKRVYTPGNAIRDGSSMLVAGRAITGYDTAEERVENGYKVIQDIVPALN